MITPKKHVTIAELETIPLEKPSNAKDYWKGVRHDEFLASLVFAVTEQGWTVDKIKLALNPSLSDMSGSLSLQRNGESSCMGFRNSNSMRKRTSFYAGTEIERDGTQIGIVAGEYATKRKHGRNVVLPSLFKEVVAEIPKQTLKVRVFVKQLHRNFVSRYTASRIATDLIQRNVVKKTRLFDELGALLPQEEGEVSLFALYCVLSKAIKKAPPIHQLDLLLAITETLKKEMK